MDRAKAIVDAAEKLAKALTIDGVVKHPCDAELLPESTQAHVADLARAIALPAHQWTRTPPSEPGCHYWARWISAAQGRTRRPFFVRVDSDGRLDPGFFADEIAEVEFWPIPISSPPESP